MPTVNLLVAMLVISFISTILEDITENKRGGDSMKKILHTKVTVKTLIKSISKNTAVISRSVAATALSANAFYISIITAVLEFSGYFCFYILFIALSSSCTLT